MLAPVPPASAQTVTDGDHVLPAIEQCEQQLFSAPAAAARLAGSVLAQPDLAETSQARALVCLLHAQQTLGDHATTVTTRARLLALVRSGRLPARLRNLASLTVAASLQQSGQAVDALAIFEDLLNTARREHDAVLQINVLLGCAQVHAMQLDDPQGALPYFEQALDLIRQMPPPPETAGDVVLHYNYGYTLLLLHRHADAEREFAIAERIGQRLSGQDVLLQRIVGNRAQIALERGDPQRARQLLEPLLAWQRSHGDLPGEVVSEQRLARIELVEGHARQALDLASAAQRQADSANLADESNAGLALLAEINTALGDDAAAARYRQRALAVEQARAHDATLARLARLQAQSERKLSGELVAASGHQRDQLLRNVLIAALALLALAAGIGLLYLRRAHRRLAAKGRIDELTGVLNRHEGAQRIGAALAAQAATEPDRRGVLFLAGIDHFEAINEQYGHAVGDRVLARFAQLLRETCDGQDILVRWIGTEFLVARPDSSQQAAFAFAEHLCKAAEHTRVDLPADSSMPLTISLGAAPCPFFPGRPHGWQESLPLADRAIRVARRAGGGWAAMWGLEAGHGVDLYSVRRNPEAAQAQGWVGLYGSRPMSWAQPRTTADTGRSPPRQESSAGAAQGRDGLSR
ncbi:MAG: diguanylate cyclase [Pseudoxanthomonas sp.]